MLLDEIPIIYTNDDVIVVDDYTIEVSITISLKYTFDRNMIPIFNIN